MRALNTIFRLAEDNLNASLLFVVLIPKTHDALYQIGVQLSELKLTFEAHWYCHVQCDEVVHDTFIDGMYEFITNLWGMLETSGTDGLLWSGTVT